MKILTTVVTAATLAVSSGANANDHDTVEMHVQLHLDQTLNHGSSLAIDELLEAKTNLRASDHALDRVTITARNDDAAAIALIVDEYKTRFVELPESDAAVWQETTLHAPVTGVSDAWRLQTEGDVTIASLELALIPLTSDVVNADTSVSNTYITRIRRGPLDRRRWRPAPVRPVIVDRGPSISLSYVSSRYRPDHYRSPLARTIAYRTDPYWSDPFWYSNRYSSRPIIRQPIIVTGNAYHDRRGVRQRDRSNPRTTATPRPRADKPRARVPRNRAERQQPRQSERRTRRGIPVREDV